MTKADRIAKILPDVEGLLTACRLCGHCCGVNRLENEPGRCRTDSEDARHIRCASYTLHFGEEPPLVGKGGSGTVFFAHCNLSCVFCQNHQISQEGMGQDFGPEELARIFLSLQEQDAENINLVTPTHSIYPALLALGEACRNGLDIPLVYNTNGYDSVELLALLDGIVDIYLPDMKYMDPTHGEKYSSAKDYPKTAKNAIKEMYRQAGKVRLTKDVAQKGVIIRHLILPNHLAGSYDFLLWLKGEGIMDVTLSLMSQYAPRHRASEYAELDARIPHDEYRAIVEYALELGFDNLLTQGLDSADTYLPDFRKDNPF